MGTELKLVGLWIESIWDEQACPPQELAGELPGDSRLRLSDYLDRGAELAAYLGASWCRFGCEGPLGCRELHDGEWAWPEGLSHYVREHHLILPEELVRKATAGARPDLPHQPNDRPRDTTAWFAWCASRRSGALRPALERAQTEARRRGKEEERLRLQAAAAKAARVGVSESECAAKGCSERALKGSAYCAYCFGGGPRGSHGPSRAFDSPEALARILNGG
ncbi:MAG: hypothetical protein HY553_06905 [Elusimicrobia bacterium]|nr:hypothetical protein [Elusimicrobiota bacterium]